MLKFLLGVVLMAGALYGIMFYYLRDVPFFAYLFPEEVIVHGAKSPERIAVETIVGIDKLGDDINNLNLAEIYDDAVKRKFEASAQPEEGKLVITLDRYLALENDLILTDLFTDKNEDGEISKNEWRSKHEFGRLDYNKDKIITKQEMWRFHQYDKTKWFKDVDTNSDEKIDEAEFTAAYDGKGEKFATDVDSNGNNFLDETELNGAKHEYGVYRN